MYFGEEHDNELGNRMVETQDGDSEDWMVHLKNTGLENKRRRAH